MDNKEQYLRYLSAHIGAQVKYAKDSRDTTENVGYLLYATPNYAVVTDSVQRASEKLRTLNYTTSRTENEEVVSFYAHRPNVQVKLVLKRLSDYHSPYYPDLHRRNGYATPFEYVSIDELANRGWLEVVNVGEQKPQGATFSIAVAEENEHQERALPIEVIEPEPQYETIPEEVVEIKEEKVMPEIYGNTRFERAVYSTLLEGAHFDAKNGLTSHDIKKQTGHGDTSTSRALRQLLEDGYIDRFPISAKGMSRGYVYWLTKTTK